MQEEELNEKILKEPTSIYRNTKGLPKGYISPFEDWAFKKIFASEDSKEVARAFLNAVLKGKRKIETIEFGKNEFPGEIKREGAAVFDFHCTDKDGAKFLVEVQRQEQDYFIDRSLFYASRLISDMAPKGDHAWKYNLKEIYSISLLEDFSLPDTDPDKYFHQVSLCNVDTGKVFYDKLHFTYIEFEKFNKMEAELDSELDEWLYALKHISEMTEEPHFLKTPELKHFVYLANHINLDEEEREIHRLIQKKRWDKHLTDYIIENKRKKAVEAAVEEAAETAEYKNSRSIAGRMLANGVPVAQIIEFTQLSEEEVIAIK